MNFLKKYFLKKRGIRQKLAVLNNGGDVSQGYLEWSLAFASRIHIVDEKLSKLDITVTWPSYHE